MVAGSSRREVGAGEELLWEVELLWGGGAAVGGGAKCSSCNMTATGGGSFNMAAKFHLPVLNYKAKVGGEPRNGTHHKMATSDWRRRQISFLPKSVMMSPFHEEQASCWRKAAAGSGGMQTVTTALGSTRLPLPCAQPKDSEGTPPADSLQQ